LLEEILKIFLNIFISKKIFFFFFFFWGQQMQRVFRNVQGFFNVQKWDGNSGK
jgi:hypothetical protein